MYTVTKSTNNLIIGSTFSWRNFISANSRVGTRKDHADTPDWQ